MKRARENIGVFIADDSKLIRERLVGLISRIEGVEIVGEAADAIEALNSIQRLKPDFVVLDLRMPGGGGIRVLTGIKERIPETVVIVLTNFPELQYRQRCREAGAEHFFDKSSEFEKVGEVLRCSAA